MPTTRNQLPIGCSGSRCLRFASGGESGWLFLWGVLQRRLRHRGGQHHAIGVYDRITWNFVRYILGYRRQMAPRVRTLITDHAPDADVIQLRSRRAARRYLAGVTSASRRRTRD